MATSRPTPAQTVTRAVRELGEPELVRRCVRMLGGADPIADPELRRLLELLATSDLRMFREGRFQLVYWPRVWAIRVFLYAWDPAAQPGVLTALGDEAWRVREMACKVIAKREIGAAGDRLPALLDDEVPRVRAAAARALGFVGEAEHAEGLRRLVDEDTENAVRARAEDALARMGVRLDRDPDELGRDG